MGTCNAGAMNHAASAQAASASLRNRSRRADPASGQPPIPYTVKLAADAQEFRAALRLRYEVFNVELREGLQSSHATGYDFDSFDAVTDHILVKCAYSRRVVGTYRLQTGIIAARNLGYYSEKEFDFTPYEPLRPQLLELGRACIHQDHRNTQVLMLLWKAIAQCGIQRGCRYLIGCSSLSSQELAIGAAVYEKLKKFLVAPELQTAPQRNYVRDLDAGAVHDTEETRLPKLLRAYLTVGAQVCGPPALDAQFGTIDFLTLLDLARVPKGLFSRLSL
jgi:putative hemolysin